MDALIEDKAKGAEGREDGDSKAREVIIGVVLAADDRGELALAGAVT